MPINIGFIASYTLAYINDPAALEFRFYTDPDIMLKEVKDWQPDVVGLANYCWNSELASVVFKQAKKTNKQTVCVAGGPDFPTNHQECREYLIKKPEIDFYVYFEGEQAFAQLIKKIKGGVIIDQLKSEPQEGIMSIHPQTKNLVFGPPTPRIINMDEIPSPYLTGLMDQWFNGSYAPVIETARGCPFTCGYCFVGSQHHYSRVAFFSVERIKQDLDYIVNKIKPYLKVPLEICDSDFGMYERDEEVARYISELQDKFGWPNAINANTGKSNYKRILNIATILKNKMTVTCSVQSLNPETLAVIKRRNPTIDEYKEINAEIKKRGMKSVSEAIVPMPEETKDSFFKGLKIITDIIGVGRVNIYTTMLLKGTHLASDEYRKKYQMQTKFRLVPRQFGEYDGEKCFEIEEVCIATSTMPFEDYLEIRGFSLISAFFVDNQFDLTPRHLKELGISIYDYLYFLWQMIKSGQTDLSKIYNQFIEETKIELWDSPEAIYDYFTKPENYQKLLDMSLGDNLIRKYKTKLLMECGIQSIELAYTALEKIAPDRITEAERKSLAAAKSWMIALRDVSAVYKKGESYINTIEELDLPYDVNAWYLAGHNAKPLATYNQPVSYQIFYDTDNLKMIFDSIKKLYGGDFAFQFSKLLVDWGIKNFWRQCEVKK
ncbi:MAG: radical SAM protein [Patescibacteria group bacterium]